MATDYFPQEEEEGTAREFADTFRAISYPHVEDGFAVSSAGGLTVRVGAGSAIIAGGLSVSDAQETVSVMDNTETYVGIRLRRENGQVINPSANTDLFAVSSSAQASEDYLPLALVEADDGGITSIRDLRWRSATCTYTAVKSSDEERIQEYPEPDYDLSLPLRRDRTYRVRLCVGMEGDMDGGYLTAPSGSTRRIFGFGLGTDGVKDIRTTPGGPDVSNREARYYIKSSRAHWVIEGTVVMGSTTGLLTLWWEGYYRDPLTLKAGSYLEATDITY